MDKGEAAKLLKDGPMEGYVTFTKSDLNDGKPVYFFGRFEGIDGDKAFFKSAAMGSVTPIWSVGKNTRAGLLPENFERKIPLDKIIKIEEELSR